MWSIEMTFISLDQTQLDDTIDSIKDRIERLQILYSESTSSEDTLYFETTIKQLGDLVKYLEKTSVVFVSCVWTEEDVKAIANEYGIDIDVALERADEWGQHIAGTMNGYIAEQLTDAIRTGTV